MAKSQNLELHVKILQNGHPVAETVKSVRNHNNVVITTSYKGDLTLPFYPLAKDIDLFTVKNKKVRLRFDLPWAGFITSHGEILDFDAHKIDSTPVFIGKDDYGSIYYNDLRVLFKLQAKAKSKTISVKKDKSYKASLLSLLFDGRSEGIGFAWAFMLSLIVFAGILSWSYMTPDTRPHYFYQLSNNYTLPFIHPDHLETAPEALQNDLDRTNYVQSVILFNESRSNLIMGFNHKQDSHQPSTAFGLYNELYKNWNMQKIFAIEKQYKLNKSQLRKVATGVIYIPSVIGESVNQRLLQLIDKTKASIYSYKTRLSVRRKVTEEFRKDEDYDWVNYKNSALGIKKPRMQNGLGKIRLYAGKTNEEVMYLVGEQLAQEARSTQNYIFSHDHDEILSRKTVRPIYIPSGKTFASFVKTAERIIKEEKIHQIHAQNFGVKKKKKVYREPLIGKIDPKLVERVVSKNKFQLQLCYELALRRNQVATGNMNWQWRIDSRGKISDITLLKSNINDSKMIKCIKRKMAIWKFPRPRRGSVKVNHSFHFAPQKG